MSRTWIFATVLLVVTAAACGSDGGNDDAATADDKPTTTTTASTTTTVAPSTTAAPAPPTNPASPPTTTAPGTGGAVDVALTISVTSDGTTLASGTLSCGTASKGTGHVASAAAAQAACDLLRKDDAAVKLLVYGPPADLLCTEIYGGPEVGKVTGNIGAQRVNTTLTRTDGCGIANWNTLQALLV